MKLLPHKILTALILSVALASLAADPTPAADNSGKNKRDDSVTEMTADNQSNNKDDVELTRKIRAELMRTKDLSTYGKNVKIITMGTQVILKGPVRSTAEKNKIAKVAHAMAPTYHVQNELEVTK